MNTDKISGQMDQLTGKIKEKWGQLTNDDVALYNGQQEQFYGKLKEAYGVAREDAEKQIKDIQHSLNKDAA